MKKILEYNHRTTPHDVAAGGQLGETTGHLVYTDQQYAKNVFD